MEGVTWSSPSPTLSFAAGKISATELGAFTVRAELPGDRAARPSKHTVITL